LSSGKFIAPQVLENKIKEFNSVEQVMVIGEHEKFASALIFPNFDLVKDWCDKNEFEYRSKEDLIQIPEVYSLIGQDIRNFNKDIAKAEQILKFKLVADEWTPASGELSHTLKLKRKFIADKYQNQICQIYSKHIA
jgi:long-chain acyl-CoA synthetase